MHRVFGLYELSCVLEGGVTLNRKKESQLPYDIMMEELFYSDVGSHILGQVVSPEHWETASNVPLRYRLIGLGFMKHQCLEELNNVLKQHGCRSLYARNSFECTLIYAFSHHLSYGEWKKIFMACDTVRSNCTRREDGLDTFFQNTKITLGELEQYVKRFSAVSERGLETKNVTYVMNEEIQGLDSDHSSFFRFYASSMDEFTDVHEKARYYFCKFFYRHLMDKIDHYISRTGGAMPDQEHLVGLLPLKAESVLRRRSMEPAETMEILKQCPISPGALFEEFNYYFFGYVSTDWVELFLENVSEMRELSAGQLHMLANAIREMTPKKKRKELADLEDAFIVKNKIDELQGGDGKKGSRKGEAAMRKYIRGELDLDRTTLICFLLYFSSSFISRKAIGISSERLDEMLNECGFSTLQKENAFDEFVMHYIASKDPVDFLMLEMDRYISAGKNFYLYEMYSQSRSNAADIRKMMFKNLI